MRQLATKVALGILLVPLLLSTLFVTYIFTYEAIIESKQLIDMFMICAVLVMGCEAVWKAIRTKSAPRLLSEDRRPPILYLRTFDDDNRIKLKKYRKNLASYVDRTILFEEFVVGFFSRFGPVIAIGRPGEFLPPVGAAREYVGDDQWQERVKELIRQSRAILIVPGRTAGIRWELRTLAETGELGKVIIVFPPATHRRLQDRWSCFRGALADQGRYNLPSEVGKAALFGVFPGGGACRIIDGGYSRRGNVLANIDTLDYAFAFEDHARDFSFLSTAHE